MIYIDSSGKLNLSKLHDNQKKFITSKYLHTGIVGGYQCLPGYSEYLTIDGWKRIDQYSDEEILVFDKDTHETFYEKPYQYIDQEANGFIKFSTDTIKMEVSPDHKVLYSTEKIKDYRSCKASELPNRVRIPRTFKAPDLPGIDLTDDQIRLQVAISADGSIQNKTRIRFNFKRQDKKDRIINLLNSCDIDYTIYNNNTGDGYMKLAFIPPVFTKDLSFLFKANERQLSVIADECRYWDGSVYKCGSVEVSGIDKNSLSLIQYAITTTGKAASLLITDKREYKGGDMYNVREYKHNYSGLRYCEKEITHHDRQYCFTTSTGFFIVRQNGAIFPSGNSGKSSVATIKALIHLMQYPGIPIAYYLPIFRLFDDMLIPKLDELSERIGMPYRHNQQKGKIITPYGEMWLRSMDTPDSIVSYSVGYSIVDEVDLVHPNKRIKAMQRISSRNSYKKATANQIDFVSTPEGFAYMYNFFVKNHNENKLLLNLKTIDNQDNLAEGYIQGLREQYTEDQLKAYLAGEFVNLTSGTVYYSFDRQYNHSDRTVGEYDDLHIGIDFNIGNMSAVVHVIDDKPMAVDEITKAYDTNQLATIIKERYPKNNIFCYPDASGKNRSTNADATDLQILDGFGFVVNAKNKNPLVSDRVKNANRMFCNSEGYRGYMVNTHKCHEYTDALEKLAYDNNNIPDKSSGFDHITDAGTYFISYKYSLTNNHIPVIW